MLNCPPNGIFFCDFKIRIVHYAPIKGRKQVFFFCQAPISQNEFEVEGADGTRE